MQIENREDPVNPVQKMSYSDRINRMNRIIAPFLRKGAKHHRFQQEMSGRKAGEYSSSSCKW